MEEGQMENKIKQRQTRLIEGFLKNAAEMSSAKELADLIRDVTSHNSFLFFADILSAPSFLKLVGTSYDSALDVLRLFAFGTWHDYKYHENAYPKLVDKQIDKLKQLHFITLLRSKKEISFEHLMEELEIESLAGLKTFLVLCKTSGNMKFKLLNDSKKIKKEFVPGNRCSMVYGQSFDSYLHEAAAVEIDQDGLPGNGIVRLVRVPLEQQNVHSIKAEYQDEASRLLSMVIQHTTYVHSCMKSFGGKIYPGMFFRIKKRLFLRPEAAPTKPLSDENSKLDYNAVKMIFQNHAGLHVIINGKYEIIYPLYSENLFLHLGSDERVLARLHIGSPMLKALDENYTTFLVCHPSLDSAAARSSALVHIRNHHKYAKSCNKAMFREALKLNPMQVDWDKIKSSWMFQGCFDYARRNHFSYEDNDLGYFLLIRDWETHFPEILDEQEKLIYTSQMRNYLIEHFFEDLVAYAIYRILCFYRDEYKVFDLKGWLLDLHQVSKIEEISTEMLLDPLSLCGRFLPKNTLKDLAENFVCEMEVDEDVSDNCMLAKWCALSQLRCKNIKLYYQVLIDKIEMYGPIIYSLTIEIILRRPCSMFQRPGVMHLNKDDAGNILSMINNWSTEQVDMIVVTDGSSLSSLNDVGMGGSSIVIAKKDLYVAAAGINPQRIISVIIDMGTDNMKLHEDPLYRGLKERRLRGDECRKIIHEFMTAVSIRWGKPIVQFEYIERSLSCQLLKDYQNSHHVFNEDIQGTAIVTIAGLLGALRAQGKQISDFAGQKIVIAADNRVGPCLDVVNAAFVNMQANAGNGFVTFDSARKKFWVVDTKGLLTESRAGISQDASLLARKNWELRYERLREGASFVEVVNKIKPDAILLLSSVDGLSSNEVLRAIKGCSLTRPAIFFMSAVAQCTAEEAFATLHGNVVFASTHQYSNVNLGDGKIGYSNHVNKMYLFPGITLGTLLSGARQISNGMLSAAVTSLASFVKREDVLNGTLYPPISRIRDITKEVAAAVIFEAVKDPLAKGYSGLDVTTLKNLSKEEMLSFVEDNMWKPSYNTSRD